MPCFHWLTMLSSVVLCVIYAASHRLREVTKVQPSLRDPKQVLLAHDTFRCALIDFDVQQLWNIHMKISSLSWNSPVPIRLWVRIKLFTCSNSMASFGSVQSCYIYGNLFWEISSYRKLWLSAASWLRAKLLNYQWIYDISRAVQSLRPANCWLCCIVSLHTAQDKDFRSFSKPA